MLSFWQTSTQASLPVQAIQTSILLESKHKNRRIVLKYDDNSVYKARDYWLAVTYPVTSVNAKDLTKLVVRSKINKKGDKTMTHLIRTSAIAVIVLALLVSGCVSENSIKQWQTRGERGKIRKVLQKPDAKVNVRIEAAKALADLNDVEAVDLFIKIARDTHEPFGLCAQCIESLGVMAKEGDKRSLGALEQLSKNDTRSSYKRLPVFKVSLGRDKTLNVPLYHGEHLFATTGPKSSAWIPSEVYGIWSKEELFGFKGQVFTPLLRSNAQMTMVVSELGRYNITMNTEEFVFQGTHDESKLLMRFGAEVTVVQEAELFYPVRAKASAVLNRLSE